jgi:dolichol kinase
MILNIHFSNEKSVLYKVYTIKMYVRFLKPVSRSKVMIEAIKCIFLLLACYSLDCFSQIYVQLPGTHIGQIPSIFDQRQMLAGNAVVNSSQVGHVKTLAIVKFHTESSAGNERFKYSTGTGSATSTYLEGFTFSYRSM